MMMMIRWQNGRLEFENRADLAMTMSASWSSGACLCCGRCRHLDDSALLVFLVVNRQMRLEIVQVGTEEAADVANKLQVCGARDRHRGRGGRCYDQR